MPPEDIELLRQRDAKRLKIMEGYCRTTGCLRNYILAYFGEKREKACDNCGNCHGTYEVVDMTEEAKKVINCVYETRGRFGLSIVLGTLLGSGRARLKEVGATEYKTYGALEDHSEADIRALIDQLLQDGYLIQTMDRYSVLRMGDIRPLKDESTRVLVRKSESREPLQRPRSRRRSKDSLTKAGYEFFDALRALRYETAREEAVPPYIIFSDKTLTEMCLLLPKNRAQKMEVSGVGNRKYERYGEFFLSAIAHFLEEHPGATISIRDEDGEELNSSRS